MNKNINLNQVLLIGIATILLFLTAASFYLLRDPSAPLPFAPEPSETIIPIQPSFTNPPASSATPLPTRQTSYTPLARLSTPTSITTPGETATVINSTIVPTAPGASLTPSTAVPSNTPRPTNTSQAYPGPGTTSPQPTAGPTNTLTPTSPGDTAVPTATPTLLAGEFGVIGRILRNGTPVPNVVINFYDDNPLPRQAKTDSGGHYWFTTLAPGTNFTLEFDYGNNPQLTPIAEVASLAWITGDLPLGVNIISLPDLDVSLNIQGTFFQLTTPVDGAAYSAAAIGPNNQIQFVWTSYNLGEYYFVELGQTGSDALLWTSNSTSSTDAWWNGTLDTGDHVTEGAYWWHVGVKKTIAPYDVYIFTQNFDLLFNP